MKRICILLFAVLLLAGCGAGDPEITTQQTTIEETQKPTVPGLYLPDSRLEQSTGGALKVYPLEDGAYNWIGALGTDLMLASDGSNPRVLVLSGDKCVPKNNTVLRNLEFSASQTGYARITGGFACYSPRKNQVLYYNTALTQTNKLQLPDEISGTVGILTGSGKVYYCVGTEIMESDPNNGIIRMVRQFSAASVEILGSYCSGRVLHCQVTDDFGQTSVCYISSQTGQTLASDPGLLQLDTNGDDFFAVLMDGTLQLQLFGDADSVSQLNVQQGSGSFHSALAIGGVVHSNTDENSVVTLNYYDLSTGLRSSSLALEDISQPVAYYADSTKGCIWFLTRELSTDTLLLCRWNVASGGVGDETLYSGPYFTPESPDAEGLALCQQRVDELNSKYFTRIYIWQDALEKTQGYSTAGEHQVSVINGMLDSMETLMAQLPEDFLWDSADGTDSNRLRICLVRSIDGGVSGKQYWHDGECYILIASGSDAAWELLKGASYAVVSHTLGNAVELDNWSAYNPPEFVYGTIDEQYLMEDNRYFAERNAMLSLTEDRALTFAYATASGNEALFNSDCMRYKLNQLCLGIRDAYRLTRYTQVLPWEQYLKNSLAYQSDQ